jgi:plastocyanin
VVRAEGTHVRTIGTAVLLALAVAFAAPAAAGVAPTKVKIANYAFKPATLTIPVGTKVTWTDQDNDAHNVTSTKGPARFTSPTLTKGKSYSHTFRKVGTYRYVCTFHANMHATVKVVAAR